MRVKSSSTKTSTTDDVLGGGPTGRTRPGTDLRNVNQVPSEADIRQNSLAVRQSSAGNQSLVHV